MTIRGERSRRRLAGVCAAFVALALSPLAAGSAHADETITTLFQQKLPNVEGKTFTTIRVDFGPGAQTPPHRHGQAFVFAYVLAGTVRSQLDGEPAKVYHAGEFWFEPPGAHHVMSDNVSTTLPATLLVTFIADTGQHLKDDDAVGAH